MATGLEAIERVETGLDGVRLDGDGVAAWMQSVNNIRLILGERLPLDEMDLLDGPEVDEPLLAIYEWLGYLLGSLVETADEISAAD